MKDLKDYQSMEVKDLPKGLVAVKLSTSWCGPCKLLAKTFPSITGAELATVDADEDNNFMTTYGVRSVPTTLIFKDGELQKKVVGNNPDQIQSEIDMLNN